MLIAFQVRVQSNPTAYNRTAAAAAMPRAGGEKTTCENEDPDGKVCGLPAEDRCILGCCVGLPAMVWFAQRGEQIRQVVEHLQRGVSKDDTRKLADLRRDPAATLKEKVGVPAGARPCWCQSRVSFAPDRACCRWPGKSLLHDQPAPTCRRRICHLHHPVKGMDPHSFKDHKMWSESYGHVLLATRAGLFSPTLTPRACAGCHRSEICLKAT